jgi:transposase
VSVSRVRPRLPRPTRPRYPSSVTDAQWELIRRRLVPPVGRAGRSRKHDLRDIVDAVFYLVRGGITWRMLPAHFPPWQTVYWWFARWSADQTWRWLNDMLRDLARVRAGRFPQPSAAIIDSQSVRAAETVAAGSRGYDAGKKINGRKRHIAVDTDGLLLLVLVTAASVADRYGGRQLLILLREKFCNLDRVWADSAYAGTVARWIERVLFFAMDIVKRPRPDQQSDGFTVLPRRWVVERTFAWITRNRRTVRDYERLPTHHEAIIHITMIMLMSRRLTRAQTT